MRFLIPVSLMVFGLVLIMPLAYLPNTKEIKVSLGLKNGFSFKIRFYKNHKGV